MQNDIFLINNEPSTHTRARHNWYVSFLFFGLQHWAESKGGADVGVVNLRQNIDDIAERTAEPFHTLISSKHLREFSRRGAISLRSSFHFPLCIIDRIGDAIRPDSSLGFYWIFNDSRVLSCWWSFSRGITNGYVVPLVFTQPSNLHLQPNWNICRIRVFCLD